MARDREFTAFKAKRFTIGKYKKKKKIRWGKNLIPRRNRVQSSEGSHTGWKRVIAP
jgi:hypothetical protein